MKILFVIDQVYLHGGIERVLSIKANYFASQKENLVYIITTEQKGKDPCYAFDPKIVFEDLKIDYERSKSYFHPVNLFKIPKHIQRVKSVIRKISPDYVVVCSHSVDTYFMPFVARPIPKIKEFHYSRSIESKFRTEPGHWFKKIFLKFADYVEGRYDRLIVLNPDEAHYYKSKNVNTIPNPLTFFPKDSAPLTQKVVMTAGRVAPVKGYDHLIDIWKLVHAENQDWKLHIFGGAESRYLELLQQKIDVYGLGEHVFLMGATDDIESKMLHSSIFAMTSHNECFPLVLLEAQACGLPIVSFDCPHGPRNIINEDTGKLVKLYDNFTFAQTLLELMAKPIVRKEMGANAKKNAQRYTIEKIMGLWSKMFLEVVNNKSL